MPQGYIYAFRLARFPAALVGVPCFHGGVDVEAGGDPAVDWAGDGEADGVGAALLVAYGADTVAAADVVLDGG